MFLSYTAWLAPILGYLTMFVGGFALLVVVVLSLFWLILWITGEGLQHIYRDFRRTEWYFRFGIYYWKNRGEQLEAQIWQEKLDSHLLVEKLRELRDNCDMVLPDNDDELKRMADRAVDMAARRGWDVAAVVLICDSERWYKQFTEETRRSSDMYIELCKLRNQLKEAGISGP
jgi:hypothetical protein